VGIFSYESISIGYAKVIKIEVDGFCKFGKCMSSGYLMVSETNIDEIQKNRHMKFGGIAKQGNYYVHCICSIKKTPYDRNRSNILSVL